MPRSCGLALNTLLEAPPAHEGVVTQHRYRAPHEYSPSSFVHTEACGSTPWRNRVKCLQTSFADIDRHRARARSTAFGEEKEPAKEGPPEEEKEAEKEEKAEDEDKEGGDEEEKEDIGEEHGGHEKIGSVTVEEEETLNLGPSADVLPLCEDLNHDSVHMGDTCWSTCEGQCPNDVLANGEGLAFDFDEFKVGHPGCTSHFECMGNHDRVLCHGVQAVEEEKWPWQSGFSSPWPLIGAACAPQYPHSVLRQSPVDASNRSCGQQARWTQMGSQRLSEFL